MDGPAAIAEPVNDAFRALETVSSLAGTRQRELLVAPEERFTRIELRKIEMPSEAIDVVNALDEASCRIRNRLQTHLEWRTPALTEPSDACARRPIAPLPRQR